MGGIPRCGVCDARLSLHGQETRCGRCSEPCPTCGRDVALCLHPLPPEPPRDGVPPIPAHHLHHLLDGAALIPAFTADMRTMLGEFAADMARMFSEFARAMAQMCREFARDCGRWRRL